ncbi:MAG: UDP-N-acetylmuramoyl-L-alanyl-D-glutamate--2,6-diaminopimelate ligase [Prolixibacteraceae bacterium]|jgi:UDP-N-acetylmuramoyl-L-alanyl-D-glutamate--2,6-diaminopimelate ligase|nr:UDP-N-acetylmuramoyl-L-alanyl-D-glutamate--2,6-diaminopimelate ligase [Prolixibacteraceae bacterium]MDD4754562.1 UDP-N-acetylmuramoyl-L-alanyl-D-glutamate--2,6-diaminopimelate ligase [Prolixibacteraceae bacterium]NLO03422.1 UDP-N-acetylmuramoyl-L-alanyl-D-glutamate--2,6-diaminopimelate ligase [Bacteroidales bacterium]
MKLNELLQNVEYIEMRGPADQDITSVESDSRKVEEGYAFVACRGLNVDGHKYISSAVKAGAKAVFCEYFPDELKQNVTYIKVANPGRTTGELASAFYGFPSKKMKVVGVTGTNGKTSIATLLYKLFLQLGYKAGLISTISYNINREVTPASHTTPDGIIIQKLMARMVGEGCSYCFMEVSSHAIQQNRIAGIVFAGGVFTNITHDHLDYHKTFAEYIKAKKRFFDNLPSDAFALINIDDKNGRVMVQNSRAEVITYSVRSMAEYRCKVLENHFNGTLLRMDDVELWTRFVGKFNASNLLAVYAVAVRLEQDKETVLKELSRLTPVKGRFENIRSLDGKIAIVDYAHTPDALKNVLNAISEIRTGHEQVITIIGAGGDRDKSKRPEMTKEALKTSDKVILTSDNPRSEEPAEIIRDMEAGIDSDYRNKVVSIENRREAIKTAVMIAKPGDIILIAGKGHENYQEVKGVRHHFDDAEEVKKCFGIENNDGKL